MFSISFVEFCSAVETSLVGVINLIQFFSSLINLQEREPCSGFLRKKGNDRIFLSDLFHFFQTWYDDRHHYTVHFDTSFSCLGHRLRSKFALANCSISLVEM